MRGGEKEEELEERERGVGEEENESRGEKRRKRREEKRREEGGRRESPSPRAPPPFRPRKTSYAPECAPDFRHCITMTALSEKQIVVNKSRLFHRIDQRLILSALLVG